MDRRKKKFSTGGAAALWATTLLSLSGCGSDAPGDGEPLAGDAPTGVAYIELKLDRQLMLGEVDYEVTGNGIPRIRGVMVVVPTTDTLSAVLSLPAGTGYMINLFTTVIGEDTECRSSSSFDVSAGRTTGLKLPLQCDELTPTGPSSGDAGTPDAASATRSDASTEEVASDASDPSSLPADAAPLPAEPDANRDAGRQTPDAGKPEVDDGAPTAGMSCEVCSERFCGETQGMEYWTNCHRATGTTGSGPSVGASRAAVCTTLMQCAHDNECAGIEPQECYCGAGVPAERCIKEGPVGPCREPWEVAGESTAPIDLVVANHGQDTALNRALRLMSCEAKFCAEACFPSRQQ